MAQTHARFGVDGLGQSRKAIDLIGALKAGAAGYNGLTWEKIEPNPPVKGKRVYNKLKNERQLLEALQQNHIELQLNLRVDSRWAIDRSRPSSWWNRVFKRSRQRSSLRADSLEEAE